MQRSENGVEWSDIIERKAQGNSSYSLTYEVPDSNPVNGINLYRLKVQDQNGTITYSRLVKASSNCELMRISIYPNPVTEGAMLSVKLNTPVAGLMCMMLYDNAGKKVMSKWAETGDNPNEVLLCLSGLAAGIYKLQVQSNSYSESFQVMVQ